MFCNDWMPFAMGPSDSTEEKGSLKILLGGQRFDPTLVTTVATFNVRVNMAK